MATMANADRDIAAIARTVSGELERPAPREASVLTDEICRRHGSAVAAVVYYGSCLRRASSEGGVLDFYVLVDSYRAAYDKRRLAWSNAMLPPNVFYLELADGDDTIRTKYAVMSVQDFARAASSKSLHSIVWSRFSQPALLTYARDEKARASVVRSLVDAVLTMVAHLLVFMPADAGRVRFTPEELWQNGFRETYGAEFRTEQPETIAQVYDAAPLRYDAVTAHALRVLERRGWLRLESDGDPLEVAMVRRRRTAVLLRWRVRRPIAKALQIPRLIKSALTFGDWLPYALFKLGRHTGIKIELTERQRRRPLIWGWPVFFRLLREQALR